MASISKMPTEASISPHQSVRPSGSRQSVRIAQLHSNVRSIKMPTTTLSSGGIGVMMSLKGEATPVLLNQGSITSALLCGAEMWFPYASQNPLILRGLDLFQEIGADQVGEVLVHGLDRFLKVSAVRPCDLDAVFLHQRDGVGVRLAGIHIHRFTGFLGCLGDDFLQLRRQ